MVFELFLCHTFHIIHYYYFDSGYLLIWGNNH